MAIKEAIQIINRMEADGVIERYAIGSAVGATFYLEPVAALDVDVFIEFRAEPGSHLVSLEPIFTYLRDRGCTMEGGHIVIAGWPVQFLPANSNLLQEALVAAVEKSVEGTSARVFTAEHIAAIALQTGRAKDKARASIHRSKRRRSWPRTRNSHAARIEWQLAAIRATIPQVR